MSVNNVSLSRTESLSTTNKFLGVMVKWNNSTEHRAIGFIASRIVGVPGVVVTLCIDTIIHGGLAVLKLPTGPIATPINFLAKPIFTDISVSSGMIHIIRMVHSVAEIALVPLLVACSPDTAAKVYNQQERLQQALKQVTQLQNELTSANSEKGKLSTQLSTFNLEKAVLENKLQSSEAALKAKQGEINSLTGQIQNKQIDILDLNNKLNQAKLKSAELEASQKKLESEKSQLDQQKSQLTSDISNLQKKIDSGSTTQADSSLRTDLNAKTQELSDLEKKRKDLLDRQKELDNALQAKESEQSSLKTQLDQSQAQKELLNVQFSQAKKGFDQQKADNDTLKAQIATKDGEISNLNTKVQDLTTKVTNLEKEKKAAEDSRSDWEQKYKSLENSQKLKGNLPNRYETSSGEKLTQQMIDAIATSEKKSKEEKLGELEKIIEQFGEIEAAVRLARQYQGWIEKGKATSKGSSKRSKNDTDQKKSVFSDSKKESPSVMNDAQSSKPNETKSDLSSVQSSSASVPGTKELIGGNPTNSTGTPQQQTDQSSSTSTKETKELVGGNQANTNGTPQQQQANQASSTSVLETKELIGGNQTSTSGTPQQQQANQASSTSVTETKQEIGGSQTSPVGASKQEQNELTSTTKETSKPSEDNHHSNSTSSQGNSKEEKPESLQSSSVSDTLISNIPAPVSAEQLKELEELDKLAKMVTDAQGTILNVAKKVKPTVKDLFLPLPPVELSNSSVPTEINKNSKKPGYQEKIEELEKSPGIGLITAKPLCQELNEFIQLLDKVDKGKGSLVVLKQTIMNFESQYNVGATLKASTKISDEQLKEYITKKLQELSSWLKRLENLLTKHKKKEPRGIREKRMLDSLVWNLNLPVNGKPDYLLTSFLKNVLFLAEKSKNKAEDKAEDKAADKAEGDQMGGGKFALENLNTNLNSIKQWITNKDSDLYTITTEAYQDYLFWEKVVARLNKRDYTLFTLKGDGRK